MPFLSRFLSRTGRPTWDYRASGVVWRVTHALPSYLIVEERDLDEKTAAYSCIDARTGDAYWKRRDFPEGWWIGMERIHDGVLFLHGFANPQLPGHRGVIAVDVATGAELWRRNDLLFVTAAGSSAYCARGGPGRGALLEMDLRTGSELSSGNADDDALHRVRRLAGSASADEVRLPVPLTAEALADPVLSRLLGGVTDTTRVAGSIEYIDHPTAVVVSIAEPQDSPDENRRYSVRLSVLDRAKGEEVYCDVLAAASPVVPVDAFFTIGDVLVYVKERTSLAGVSLAGPPSTSRI